MDHRLALRPNTRNNVAMTKSEPSRSGEVAYFCAAVVFAVVAFASVAWVLAAPSAADDQGARATLAGWALGIFALLSTVATTALGLKRKNSGTAEASATNSGPPEASATNSGNVLGGQMYISGNGTGNIGGIHFHGDAGRSDDS